MSFYMQKTQYCAIIKHKLRRVIKIYLIGKNLEIN